MANWAKFAARCRFLVSFVLTVLVLLIVFPLTALAGEIKLTSDLAEDTWPDWSSDGSKIVFSSNRSGNNDIWVMNADGTNPVQLTAEPGNDGRPDWSPDGSKIAFSNDTGVWVMNADGSNPTRLHIGGYNPAWSPDGSKIAFAIALSIWVMNADGTNPVQLTTGNLPEWSPDGTKIAFSSDRGGSPGIHEVWVMNADGTNQNQLTTNAGIVSELPYASTDWSPDGSRIAYRSGAAGNLDIWIMDADGSDQWQLTVDPAVDGLPSWSPDGNGIAFMSMRSGNRDIWVITPIPSTTPVGTNVEVSPISTMTLAFDQVTVSGGTTAMQATATPDPPSGFQFLGDTWDISTTATYTGPITATFSYDESLVAGNESDLKLFHYEGGSWVDVTTSVDTANNTITGQVTSLSPFAVGEPETASVVGYNSLWFGATTLSLLLVGLCLIKRKREYA